MEGSTLNRLAMKCEIVICGQDYRVMRFWNNDILSNIEGVLTVTDEELREISADKSG